MYWSTSELLNPVHLQRRKLEIRWKIRHPIHVRIATHVTCKSATMVYTFPFASIYMLNNSKGIPTCTCTPAALQPWDGCFTDLLLRFIPFVNPFLSQLKLHLFSLGMGCKLYEKIPKKKKKRKWYVLCPNRKSKADYDTTVFSLFFFFEIIRHYWLTMKESDFTFFISRYNIL